MAAKKTALRVRVTVKETGSEGYARGVETVDGETRYRVDLDSGETVRVPIDSLVFGAVERVNV